MIHVCNLFPLFSHPYLLFFQVILRKTHSKGRTYCTNALQIKLYYHYYTLMLLIHFLQSIFTFLSHPCVLFCQVIQRDNHSKRLIVETCSLTKLYYHYILSCISLTSSNPFPLFTRFPVYCYSSYSILILKTLL